MSYFAKETITFLKQLKKNNNREWFNDNKARYTQFVKEPFELFITDLIDAISPLIENLAITPKDAIFRIYRDVRFSKDKSPYKTHVSAIVSPGGRKNKIIPGVYFELNGEEARVYSGLYMSDSKQLKNLRSHISHNLNEFDQLITSNEFVNTFGEIRGEKNKKIQKEFEDDARSQPLLYNKQFYFFRSWPAEMILEDGLIDNIVDTYRIAKPVSEFLYEGTF
ncbi:MAG: DUF2461 domain-containing protein [Bacteroidota bacterium]